MVNWELGAVLDRIMRASEDELYQIMRAIERRYAQAYPEWEVVYMSVHREPKQRTKDLDQLITYLKTTACWE